MNIHRVASLPLRGEAKEGVVQYYRTPVQVNVDIFSASIQLGVDSLSGAVVNQQLTTVIPNFSRDIEYIHLHAGTYVKSTSGRTHREWSE